MGGSSCGYGPRWYGTAPLALLCLLRPPVWNESELGVECSIPHVGVIIFPATFVHEKQKHGLDYRAEGQIYTKRVDLRFW